METIFALLGGGGLVAVTTFGLLWGFAERRAGKQDARATELAVRLELAQATIKTEGQRADFQERRANALDDALAHAAVTGPVDGAFDRLLQTWRDARRATDRHPIVPDPGAGDAETEDAGPDDLLRPGE